MLFSSSLTVLLLFLFQAVTLAAPSTDHVGSSLFLPLNETANGWPQEPFRFPLPDYKDGYLVFRRYGASGSVSDRTVLLSLLEMVTQANLRTPAGYSSPNVDLNIPDTSVFLRSRGTAAPGFESLSTKLALSTVNCLRSLVRKYGAKELVIDVHDGYLDYGPWAIMIRASRSLINKTGRQ